MNYYKLYHHHTADGKLLVERVDIVAGEYISAKTIEGSKKYAHAGHDEYGRFFCTFHVNRDKR